LTQALRPTIRSGSSVRIASHAAAKDTPHPRPCCHERTHAIPHPCHIPHPCLLGFKCVTSVSRLLAGCIRFDACRRHLRRDARARQRELRRARCGENTFFGAVCQDRLGTDIGKVESGGVLCRRACGRRQVLLRGEPLRRPRQGHLCVARAGEKTVLLGRFYTKNDDFAKIGSGQT
jgi:hypothetical protein